MRRSEVRTLAQAAARASERLHQIQESVIHLERTPAQHDRPGHPHRIDPCVCVTELRVQLPRCDIALSADAETDAVPAPGARLLLGGIGELSRDPAAPAF